MKKLIALFLAGVMTMCMLTACGSKEPDEAVETVQGSENAQGETGEAEEDGDVLYHRTARAGAEPGGPADCRRGSGPAD